MASAPERFLELYTSPTMAGIVRELLEWRLTRTPVRWLANAAWLRRASRSTRNLSRYMAFFEVGQKLSQEDVFVDLMRLYDGQARLVVLPLNMDYMGAGPTQGGYIGQLREVLKIKARYPQLCLPFVSLDPRMAPEYPLVEFAQRYLEQGFVGIKLYPSLGFFPFDAALTPVYAFAQHGQAPAATLPPDWAQQLLRPEQTSRTNNAALLAACRRAIPLMTHCEKGGAYYNGAIGPAMTTPAHAGRPDWFPRDFALAKLTNNDFCDNFVAPSSYLPTLLRFPLLKLCFAHYGGASEIMAQVRQDAGQTGLTAKRLSPWQDADFAHTAHEDDIVQDDQRWQQALGTWQDTTTPAAQRQTALTELRRLFDKWAKETYYKQVKRLMFMFPNVYTDVSYTLYDTNTHRRVGNDLRPDSPLNAALASRGWPGLRQRILFGTDYFMTLREQQEQVLHQELRKSLGPDFEQLAVTNPQGFLTSTYYVAP